MYGRYACKSRFDSKVDLLIAGSKELSAITPSFRASGRLLGVGWSQDQTY